MLFPFPMDDLVTHPYEISDISDDLWRLTNLSVAIDILLQWLIGTSVWQKYFFPSLSVSQWDFKSSNISTAKWLSKSPIGDKNNSAVRMCDISSRYIKWVSFTRRYMISIISRKDNLLSHLYVINSCWKKCCGPATPGIDVHDDVMDWELYRNHRSFTIFVTENQWSSLNLRKGLY